MVAAAFFSSIAIAQKHAPLGAFCEPSGIGTPPCLPGFQNIHFGEGAQGMAVDPGSGDLLVIDVTEGLGGSGKGAILRFKPNGEPDIFSALGTNSIDGTGGADATPQAHLSFGRSNEAQVAVAPPGSMAGTAGNIYVTYDFPNEPVRVINIFDSTGAYKGQLTEYLNESHVLTPLGGACGVAVDSTGAIYVGDRATDLVHKYAPSANPPANSDSVSNFSAENPCALGAGAGPSAGYLFVTSFLGKVSKFDSTSGEFKYFLAQGINSMLSVNGATGRVFVTGGDGGTEVREYDASKANEDEIDLVSQFSTADFGSSIEGQVTGIAVKPSAPPDERVYVSAQAQSDQIGVWDAVKKGVPVVQEPIISDVGLGEATVSALIGAEEAPTEFHIDYVDKKSFEGEGGFASPHTLHTAVRSAVAVNALVRYEETLHGLNAHTAYRWRLVATNACAPVEGSCGTTELTPAGTFATLGEHFFELPDERRWEMVSPTFKGGAEVGVPGNAGGQHEFSVRPQQSSPDGEEMTYSSLTSFGQGKGAALLSQYISRRGAEGWETENLTPRFEEGFARDPLVGFTPDLAHAAVSTFNPPCGEGAPADLWNLCHLDLSTHETTAITTPQPQVGPGELYCVSFAGASEDFSRVFFSARNGSLLAGNPVPTGAAEANLYEWQNQTLDARQALVVKANAGKYKLNFGSGGPGVSETSEINATATRQEVQAALNAISNISAGGGSVTVSGGPGDAAGSHPYLISFDGGPLAKTSQPLMTVVSGSPPLSGGSATASLNTLANGHLALVSVLSEGAAATPQKETAFGPPNDVTGAKGCSMEAALLRHAVSADGRRAFWTLPTPRTLFARIDGPGGGKSVQVDAAQGGSASGEGVYEDASVDGSKVFFIDKSKLTPAPAQPGDLYRYDVGKREKGEPQPLLNLTAHAGEAADVLGVLGVSAKGDYAYFVAHGVLNSEPNPSTGKSAEAGQPNLYAWHEGEPKPLFIATLGASDGNDWNDDLSLQTARVSPDGRHLAFLSRKPLTGYDNTDADSGQADAEVFLYSLESEELACVSCKPTGEQPQGPSGLPTWSTPYQQPRYLLDNGRVFFESDDELDPNDINGLSDIYEFEFAGMGSCTVGSATFSDAAGGCVSLISSGTSGDETYLLDASSDGRDVFFSTRQPLVPQLDKDGNFDVYDARVGGSPPPTPPTPCEREDCRQGVTGESSSPAPGTPSFIGPTKAKPRCPKGKVRRNGRCVARHHHKRKRRHHQQASHNKGRGRR